MKAVRIVVLAVAAVSAIGLAVVVRMALTGKPTSQAVAQTAVKPKPTARVLVASRDLKVGDRLNEGDLDWKTWPVEEVQADWTRENAAPQVASSAPASGAAPAAPAASVSTAQGTTKQVDANGGLLSPAGVVKALQGGPKQPFMGAVVRLPIQAGEPITFRKIVRAGESGYLAVLLAPGERAASIPVTVDTGAGGFILPGDRVDVILTRRLETGKPNALFLSRSILRNMKVLAIDQTTQPDKDAAAVIGATATLEVELGRGRDPGRGQGGGDPVAGPSFLRRRPRRERPQRRQVADELRRRGHRRRRRRRRRQPRGQGVPLRPGVRELGILMSAFRPLLGAVLASAALLLSGAQAWAQGFSTVKVELGGAAPVSRRLSLPKGESAVVDLPVDARDVLVSNPKVADAVLRTPRRIYVLGVSSGQTDAVFFDAAGRQILSLDIRVDQPVSAIEDTIRAVAPDADVKVEAVNDSLVLTGTVADAAESDRVQRIAASFVAKPEMVINTLSIRSPEQVMIKVRVVEMQRNLIKQLGISTSALLQSGKSQFTVSNTPQFAVNNGLVGGLSGGYNYASGLNKATGTLEAFERAGLVRSLAEPTLTAVSGESAKFLAGGEFPVPSGVDQNGNVIVTFQTYGVGLGFTPVVLSGGRISMKISTEVSQLSSTGSEKFNNSLTIPALTVRRAETTVEMPSGGALMIAGLLQEETQEDVDSVPGLNAVPVLGSLFGSRDYLSGETELVVIVEPYLVKPGAPNQFQTPVDGLVVADDMDTILLGRLNKAYKGDRAPPRPSWQGPVGYVIE